jgi:hypothetical protein
MEPHALLSRNRIILSHFDSYSAALVFARFGKTLLLPEALPESAAPMQAPADTTVDYASDAVMHAAIDRYGLKESELAYMDDFSAWMQTDSGPVRIHVLRFTTFEAPAQAVESHGGVFKSISELRGSAMIELTLLRQVFNLVVGGSSSQR